MAIVRCRNRRGIAPWSAINDLEKELTRFFNAGASAKSRWAPAIDLSESEDGFVLEADLPGLGKDDINLTIEDNVVTLNGERKEDRKVEGRSYYHYERRYGNFSRSFELPLGIDSEKVVAKFEDGVLRVDIPKLEEAKPRKIEVKVK